MFDYFAHIFRNNFEQLLNALRLGPYQERLYLLLGFGLYGAYSQAWIADFGPIGCLHLLVLSGSQAQGLASATEILLSPLLRLSKGQTLVIWIRSLVVSSALLLYGVATGWNPPLTRAIFFCILRRFPAFRLSQWAVVFISLLFQVALFPQHLNQIGFYLSWMASLLLMFIGEWGLGGWVGRSMQTLACLVVVQYLLGRPIFSPRLIMIGLLANLLLGIVIEGLMQPFLSAILALSLAGLCLGAPILGRAWELFIRLLAPILAPFFDSLASALLVALHSIRYIQ